MCFPYAHGRSTLSRNREYLPPPGPEGPGIYTSPRDFLNLHTPLVSAFFSSRSLRCCCGSRARRSLGSSCYIGAFLGSVPLGPRPRGGEACHGCWEESPLPGMRPTGRWDGSRLMGEKGPLGAVPGPEPSLCDASPGASPPRARSPPGARSPHARRATAMVPPACSRSRTMRSGPRPRGRARCGMGPTAGDAAHWVQSHMTGHPEGLFPVAGPPGFAVARSPSLVPVPLRDVPSWDPRQCEASTRGNGATATRLAWGGCERRQCHVGVPAVRSPARRRKK